MVPWATGGGQVKGQQRRRWWYNGTLSTSHKADNVLDRFHGLGGDDLRARGAIAKHGIDIGGILHQSLHFGVDRSELGDGEVDECGLELRKLAAPEILQDFGLGCFGKCSVDADEVVGLRARLE